MKRLQIYIDEDLDMALDAEARRLQRSKAALIREYVADRLAPGDHVDPVDAFVGSFEAEPDLSTSVNDVVYGDHR